eukprot:scaffold676201_cov60-Prasinocladus_malaysianus.AAC.1
MFAHSEAAAGAVAMQCALGMATYETALGICHLRKLNPHLQDCFVQSSQSHMAARQPLAWSATPAALIGTSSFAYQGTNCCI